MCLRRPLDPASRRIFLAGYLCLIASFLLINFEHGSGHHHADLFTGLRFLLIGLAIASFFWSARRNRSRASRP